MSRAVKRAKAHFRKVAELQAKGPAGRAELKRMREIWFDTDAPTKAGEYFNPTGKRLVKGSDSKARRIHSAHQTKARQGMTRTQK